MSATKSRSGYKTVTETDFVKQKDGSLKHVSRTYVYYTTEGLIDLMGSVFNHDFYYSPTSASQTIKRLHKLAVEDPYTSAFLSKIHIDPSVLRPNQLYPYVIYKKESEIANEDVISREHDIESLPNGELLWPVKANATNVVNTATILAHYARIRGLTHLRMGDLTYSPRIVQEQKTPIENMPITSVSQGMKILNVIKKDKINPYYGEYLDLFNMKQKFEISDFYYTDGPAYLSSDTPSSVDETTTIGGQSFCTNSIERICINSMLMSFLSKLVTLNIEYVTLLKKYEEKLAFTNTKMRYTKSEPKQSKNQKPKEHREWIQIIYTPMGNKR